MGGRFALVALLSVLVSLSGAAACSGKDPYSPGTKLGTFHVTAKLTSTTCGPTPNPWEFDVRLNHEGSTLFWVQGGAPIQGVVDAAAKTELASTTVTELRSAEPRFKRAACSVARTDVLAMTLMGGDAKPVRDPADMTSFGGTLTYRFAPTETSDCTDQLSSAGGTFESLPCEVRYDATGAVKERPEQTQP